MGLIAVQNLQAADPRITGFAVEVYADSGLTTLVARDSALAAYDPSTGIAKMVGPIFFHNLTAGTTYYLRSCSIQTGIGIGPWTSTYSLAAGSDPLAGGTPGNVNYRGAWSAGTSYNQGDIAMYDGEAYLRLFAGGSGSASFVQSAKWFGTGVTSLAFSSSVTAGDLLIVAVAGPITATLPSDTLGTSYLLMSQETGPHDSLSVFAGLAPTSGSNTVNAGMSGVACSVVISEFANVTSTLDASAITDGIGSSVAASITTTQAGDLIYAACGTFGATVFSPSSGFTLIAGNVSGDNQGDAYAIEGSPGTLSVGFSSTLSDPDLPLVVLAFIASSVATPSEDAAWTPLGFSISDIPASGVAAGSYTDANLTVDSAGRITAASNGTGGGGSALTLLEEHTASSSTELDFTSWYSSSYDTYEIVIVGLLPATNGVDIVIEVSTNGGSTWDTTSGNYAWSCWRWLYGGDGLDGSYTESNICISGGFSVMSNVVANGGMDGRGTLYNPGSTVMRKRLDFRAAYYATSTSGDVEFETQAAYIPTTAINAFRVRASSGNLASGAVRVYGVGH